MNAETPNAKAAATSSAKPSGAEKVKAESRGLRGDIARELADDAAVQVTEATYALLKFHGAYEQFDRDTATERKQQGLEKHWSFMVRVRLPGGRLTPAQWLALDALADAHADGSLRLTSRQGVQFHGVPKGELRAQIAGIDAALLTSFGACGDVVRNITTTPAPIAGAVHEQLVASATMLSAALLPRSGSHHQIFVSGEGEPAPAEDEQDPLYGATYLPRKFKIGLAHPADNTVDILTNDLGFLAEIEDGRIVGWIACAGGGLGMTHNKPSTYPRLATPFTRVPFDRLLDLTRAVVSVQRDHGGRSDRKRARLKYLIDDQGLEWFREHVAEAFGEALPDAPALPPLSLPDHLGWHEQGDGRWWLGLPVAAGRVVDTPTSRLRTALREAVERFGVTPIVTPTQDLLLGDVAADDRVALEGRLRGHGVVLRDALSPLARWSLACVALPTCGQSLAEGERVQAPIVAAVEAALDRHGLLDERISLRITGCPNGCARPYAAEIGIVGRIPGHYSLYVGGNFEGTRLNRKLADRVAEADIAGVLEPLFQAFSERRSPGEAFGDFCDRLGIDALSELGRKAA